MIGFCVESSDSTLFIRGIISGNYIMTSRISVIFLCERLF
jgi:hypothetical protein